MSSNSEFNPNKKVTVIYNTDDVTEDDPKFRPREIKTLGEAYSEIDYSKQYNFCAKCGHDIDDHAKTVDYLTKYAGKCEKEGCECPQYYFSGIVKTQKEIDAEKSDQR